MHSSIMGTLLVNCIKCIWNVPNYYLRSRGLIHLMHYFGISQMKSPVYEPPLPGMHLMKYIHTHHSSRHISRCNNLSDTFLYVYI